MNIVGIILYSRNLFISHVMLPDCSIQLRGGGIMQHVGEKREGINIEEC
jgi:hypothetical protein